MKKYNLKPMAKLVSWGQGGVDPKIMGVGPVPASRQAMQKAGLTIDDIDLVEAKSGRRFFSSMVRPSFRILTTIVVDLYILHLS